MNDIKGIIEDVEKSSLVSNKVIEKVIDIIGQEKWQDIDDKESDICTTAGELSITLRGIADLEKENAELKTDNDARKFAMAMSEKVEKQLRKENAELQEQIEKLIDFVLSKTECCDICPITDTCINSEGTCPYAGILSKGEEAVTREWLMQKIAKEIKEK